MLVYDHGGVFFHGLFIAKTAECPFGRVYQPRLFARVGGGGWKREVRTKANILGTTYTIKELSVSEDPMLESCDGYCDKTSKKIVVSKKAADCNLDDFECYKRKVMRHEIIHAFLFESGLHENFTHSAGHDETYVDWIAAQYPKIAAVFQTVGCAE